MGALHPWLRLQLLALLRCVRSSRLQRSGANMSEPAVPLSGSSSEPTAAAAPLPASERMDLEAATESAASADPPSEPAAPTAPAAPTQATDPAAPAASPDDPNLSEYERRRKENIAANARALAALGLDQASFKRPRSEEPKPRAPRAVVQKTRISYRHHGLDADAAEEEVNTALAAAAAVLRRPPSEQAADGEAPRAPRAAKPVLTEEQRLSLASAQGWMSKMREHFRPLLSEYNLMATMQRVNELASGVGIELARLDRPVFEGRAISISDDLVALRQEAKAYADFDQGGWRLNHPIGKLIQFQQVLFNEAAPGQDATGSSSSADGSSSATAAWLSVGAEVEVTMVDEALYGARYAGRVLTLEAGKAHVEFSELEEEDQEGVPLKEWHPCNLLRPPPPIAHGWECFIKVGASCELWHEGAWWEATVMERVRLEDGADGLSVQATLFPDVKAEVGFELLRPRWAFVDGTEWLALPPLGFKVPLGTVEHTVTEESGGAALVAKRAQASAAARAEKLAAKKEREEKKKAREEAKAARLAAKARARFGGSLRGLIVKALKAGNEQRLAIVAYVAEHENEVAGKADRDSVVTVLGKEKNHGDNARWVQNGTSYQLTAVGIAGMPGDNEDAQPAAAGHFDVPLDDDDDAAEEEQEAAEGEAAAAAAAAAARWPPGELVWARIRGYPAWPATVCAPPRGVLKPKPGGVWVNFLGTHDCAECPEPQISAWNERKPSLPTKRTLHASYQKAMAEAESLLATETAPVDEPADANDDGAVVAPGEAEA